jgi:hypothetical protein
MTYDTVTENVIPTSNFQKYDRAMKNRHTYANEILDATLEFINADGEMEFMHIKSVELTQEQIDKLINKCMKYKANLGW